MKRLTASRFKSRDFLTYFLLLLSLSLSLSTNKRRESGGGGEAHLAFFPEELDTHFLLGREGGMRMALLCGNWKCGNQLLLLMHDNICQWLPPSSSFSFRCWHKKNRWKKKTQSGSNVKGPQMERLGGLSAKERQKIKVFQKTLNWLFGKQFVKLQIRFCSPTQEKKPAVPKDVNYPDAMAKPGFNFLSSSSSPSFNPSICPESVSVYFPFPPFLLCFSLPFLMHFARIFVGFEWWLGPKNKYEKGFTFLPRLFFFPNPRGGKKTLKKSRADELFCIRSFRDFLLLLRSVQLSLPGIRRKNQTCKKKTSEKLCTIVYGKISTGKKRHWQPNLNWTP